VKIPNESLFSEKKRSQRSPSLALTCLFAFAADDYNSLPSSFSWIDFSNFPPPSIALTGSPALRNFLIASSILGPGLWLVSQLLLLLYFWLDNGANTCGIDFHFEESSNTEVTHSEEGREGSNEETGNNSDSIINDDQPREDTFFEIEVMKRLFINKFNVVSEKGRWVDPQFDDEESPDSSQAPEQEENSTHRSDGSVISVSSLSSVSHDHHHICDLD